MRIECSLGARTFSERAGRFYHMYDPKPRRSQYELISKIGSGGFGTVSKAWNRVTGTVVAIKHIRVKSSSSDTIPSFVQREIDVLEKFSSNPTSHIVPFVEFIADPSDRSLYLIFKYYPYDLRALTLTNSISFSRAVLYVHGICRALDTMHKVGYVHRDVKPENVFVSADHDVALGDFGLAREIGAVMTTGIGTIYYRAPEELLGDPSYGAPVDMWALGCVMYFLAFGAVLFEGKSDADQFHQICRKIGSPSVADWPELPALPNAVLYLPRRALVKQEFGRARDVSQAYMDLMAQMLQWNPASRITAERALTHEVFGEIGKAEEPIVIKEMHQRERGTRPFCDFLLEGFAEDLEFPRLVPPCDV
jgi:serine/threonine protein kinase